MLAKNWGKEDMVEYWRNKMECIFELNKNKKYNKNA
jgi:hypothetical protein